MARTKDEIWAGDLLDRREEADQLIAFIESVVAQGHFREDAQAYTISVDASYGEGKTYFLRRVAEQVSINHPVAFVDAWRDDLADEPFTALVATLKEALGELIEATPALQPKWAEFVSKAGKIVRITGFGLTKRLASLAITSTAVDALESVVSDIADDTKDSIIDGVKKTTDGVLDDSVAATKLVAPGKLMQSRIDGFEAGQKAIHEVRESLSALVAALNESSVFPPIVIFIDELDRCRPTYAVKLLEEVKHLFDVPGLVFVFGIHTNQLAHSVSGAYGSSFDGRAYLTRFMHRQYRLKSPDLSNFVRFLLDKYSIETSRLWFPHIKQNDVVQHLDVSEIISFYLQRYEISTRDTITVIETIQTCCALTGKLDLCMPLLLPMILSKVAGASRGGLLKNKNENQAMVLKFYHQVTNTTDEIQWFVAAEKMFNWQKQSPRSFNVTLQGMGTSGVAEIFKAFVDEAQHTKIQLASPRHYEELLEAVGRFSS